MKRSALALGLSALMLVPVLAGAQERRKTEVRDGRPMTVREFSFNRARLGVTVRVRANEDSDKIGARIESVVEDGPAAKAGLKAGDIITRFNGTSLANAESEDDDASGPGMRLIELASKLEKGDTVKVDYRRDGANRSATIIADEVEPRTFSYYRGGPDMEMTPFKFDGPDGGMFRFNAPEDGVWQFDGPEGGGFNMGPMNAFTFSRNSMGLDMVELNSDLGEYFGTSDGLLVTRTPEDSTLPLRAGDVILNIDGRKPTSISHAGRILSSYEDGETVKLEIMRKHQRMTVDWKVDRPEFKVRQMLPSRQERTHRM
jgi:S1-C subfamily serine protease